MIKFTKISNKIVKWSDIKWGKFINSFDRIIFPNNIEAELTDMSYGFPIGSYEYTLKFCYNFVEKDFKLFLTKCYEVYEFLNTQTFITGEIELNTMIVSDLAMNGKRMDREYEIGVRFKI